MATLLLLILSSAPVDVTGTSAFFPAFDVMAIYFWSSYRPTAMPYWFVFILGILRDSLEGIMLGVSPFVYLLIRLIIVSSKRLYRKENFIVVWQGLIFILIIAITLKWALLSFLIDKTLVIDYAVMQFMVSIAIYPLLHWLFNIINLAMPDSFQDV
jgi:rod shape-determining protein MreD